MAFGVYAARGVNVRGLTNYGTIAATGSDGVGVDIRGNSFVVNGTTVNYGGTAANFGTIAGSVGIAFGTTEATLSNAGTIIGQDGTAVSFGGGNDLLVVYPGADFIGVVAGAGDDTIELAAGSGTLASLGTGFTGFGVVRVDPGATWGITGEGSNFVNDGTINVYGALSFGRVSRDAGERGVIALGDNGTAEFTAAVAKGETLVFTDATGTVLLDQPRRFRARFSGFAVGDVIDLVGKAADGLSFSDHELIVTEDGRTVADLRFAGHYTAGEFALSPDGNGGTDITLLCPTTAQLWTLRG